MELQSLLAERVMQMPARSPVAQVDLGAAAAATNPWDWFVEEARRITGKPVPLSATTAPVDATNVYLSTGDAEMPNVPYPPYLASPPRRGSSGPSAA